MWTDSFSSGQPPVASPPELINESWIPHESETFLTSKASVNTANRSLLCVVTWSATRNKSNAVVLTGSLNDNPF